MQLAYAFFADAAQVGQDGKLTIMGGDFDTVFAPSFPVQHGNLAIVIRLGATPDECGREHDLSIMIIGPLGESLAPPLHGKFTPMIPLGFEGGAIRATFVVNIAGLVFQTEGTYKCRILVDDSTLGELQLHVVRHAIPASGNLN